MSLMTPILTTPSVYWAKAELVASSAATAIRLRVVFMLSLHAGAVGPLFRRFSLPGLRGRVGRGLPQRVRAGECPLPNRPPQAGDGKNSDAKIFVQLIAI